MDKEFIPYEQALELKELGFDEMCVAYWTSGISGYYLDFKHFTNIHWMFTANDNKGRDKMCTAPLYQQAFRWFREKYNLDHFVQHHIDGPDETYFSMARESTWDVDTHDTYEKAEIACLKKLIEIVKNK